MAEWTRRHTHYNAELRFTLQDADQRFGVEAVGGDDALRYRPLEPVDVERVLRAQHGQAVERVVPEVGVVLEAAERSQQGVGVGRREALLQ